MARTRGTILENNFVGGLNTEANSLAFPTNACTETYNCVFDEFGKVSRRKELDIELDASYSSGTEYADTQAFSEYLWTTAGSDGSTSMYVVQIGSVLAFYNVSVSTNVSNNALGDFINLDTHIASGSPYDPRDYRCQYASANGKLIVTNKACDPILVTYDAEAQDVTGTKITIKYRDLQGLDSPYGVAERPSFATIAAMKTDTDGAIHFYNLLNQGWHNGGISSGSPDSNSALGQWDTALSTMPSDSDYVGFYRSSETDPFDVNKVTAYSQGSTVAPKGHFILNYGTASRRDALEADGYSLTYTSSGALEVSGGTGSNIGSSFTSVGALANLFDDDTNTNHGIYSTSTTVGTKSVDFYAGKNYGGSAIPVYKAIIKPLSNKFYGWAYYYSGFKSMSFTFDLRASNTVPSSGGDGTLLGTVTFSTTGSGTQPVRTITSNDTSTTYQYVWVRVRASFYQGSVDQHDYTVGLSEIIFYETDTASGTGELPDPEATYERPITTTIYASRAWYAGGADSNIYYSQIIEDNDSYGKCYQRNDPTSEYNAQLLPTDGGVIRIPEIGAIKKLYAQQSSLLVFASNGVWVISGSGYGATFDPTSYVIKKLSSQGTQSPHSFIDVQGLPMWWGEDGIFQMEYNPQFDSFSLKRITIENIQTFYDSIPVYNKTDVKGAYDSKKDVAYWLYRSTSITGESRVNEYDAVLCYNTRSKAFYPWIFDVSDLTPEIKGIGYVVDAIGFEDSAIKFTVSVPITSVLQRVTFADTLKETPTYTDWNDFEDDTYGVSGDARDYSSYFVTGYRLDTQANKFMWSNYVWLYLKVETNSGAYLQGIFDFANTAQSGDWSVRQEASKQQVYNLDNVERDYHARKLKIRGRGKALQYRVTSQTGKPFTIMGWAVDMSANAET